MVDAETADHDSPSGTSTSTSPPTASPPPESMELGFQASLGPLSQISVQLFSPETAVHLAVGVLGWYKARQRAESVEAVLKAQGASLAPIGAFNAENYTGYRSEHPTFGAVRQEGGKFISRPLPVASSSTHGDTGLKCLYGMITALLCFFDEENTCVILMDVLPGILHYEQVDHQISKDGPLCSAVKAFIREVAKEEKNSKATEILLKHIDELRMSATTSSLRDVLAGKTIDSHEVSAFLLWLSMPFSKRLKLEDQAYPTRSFLVWAMAEVLRVLGFGIHVSRVPVVTHEQYASIFHNSRHIHELEVHLVPVPVGKTDPHVRPGINVTVVPHVRLVPLRSIPNIELRQHFAPDNEIIQQISTVWSTTFQHVQQQLRGQTHIQEMIGPNNCSDKQTEYGNTTQPPRKWILSSYQEEGLRELSRSWSRSSPQSLHELLAKPVCKSIQGECTDCTAQAFHGSTDEGCWTEVISEDDSVRNEEHNQIPKIVMKAILLAAAYAIACLFVMDGESPAGLNTEVVFVPSKSGQISNCFSLEDRDWAYHFMSVAAVGKARKHSTQSERGRVQFTGAVFRAMSSFEASQFIAPETFGCYSNGMSILSKFLLDPVHPFSYHTFVMQFGQLLDLPLDENSLITSVKTHQHLPAYPLRLAQPKKSGLEMENNASGLVRWDIDPDWANSEYEIHFRCRIDGFPLHSITPLQMVRALENSRINVAHCNCSSSSPPPDGSILLAECGQRFNVVSIPFTSIRRHHLRIRLEQEVPIPKNPKPQVVVMRAGSNSVEQWLALCTEIQATPGRPNTILRRVLAKCMSCGFGAIEKDQETDGTLHLLVLSSR